MSALHDHLPFLDKQSANEFSSLFLKQAKQTTPATFLLLLLLGRLVFSYCWHRLLVELGGSEGGETAKAMSEKLRISVTGAHRQIEERGGGCFEGVSVTETAG